MPRYSMIIEYDGSRFCGWQVQPNQISVQQRLQETIGQIVQQSVHVMGAGRTDAGVHARGQVAAFDLIEPYRDLKRLERSINGLLGGQIAVREIREVAEDFQPRHDARVRHYSYRVLLRRSPLREPYGWVVRQRTFNITALQREAQLFLGEHDFLSFSFPRPEMEHTLCTIHRIDVVEEESAVVIHFYANRYLHHMVRAMVGHLVDVAKGLLPEGSASEILNGTTAGPRRWAPAQGLTLESVSYEPLASSNPSRVEN